LIQIRKLPLIRIKRLPGKDPYNAGKITKRGNIMLRRIVFSLIIAALAVLPTLSRADEVKWEVINVYALAEGQRVAVAVPAEWQVLDDGRDLGAGAGLRFVDESGVRIHVSAAELRRAAAHKRVIRPHDEVKVAARAGAGS